ncbi:23S rRNA (uracil(1939)-C(5))-methyltransferase RlmD [Clostridium vitabionis]|uniref:23S rRNA (uracil(1939)-C(5))-methyltransferase RlmD n=1 Tax=Clostridium vitabionis TaxID=2784388 RepID=UPI00188C3B51|nr:23S rRNA (uracil(1939)-C(5))-methyltransferase RlmD [Clostridium vitabionis]
MKKGLEYEGNVLRMDFPNRGIVRVESDDDTDGDGGLVTVKGAIPGQRVRFVVSKRRGERMEGRLREVTMRSPLETEENPCPHYGICGGCLYQTVPASSQREIKKDQVLRLLTQVSPEIAKVFEGIFPGPDDRGYRNKMEYSFGDETKDGAFALGLHRAASFYDIVTTDRCQLVHPDFCAVLRASKEYFAASGVPFYRKMQHTGYLRHLLVRRSRATGEMLVDLVTTTQLDPERERELLGGFVRVLRELPLSGSLASVLHTRNDSLADAVKDEGTEVLFGRDYITECLLGLAFRITPFSFFQTNSGGAEVLYGKVREYALEALGGKAARVRTIYDLYSGTGTIAQILAPVAEHVVGVEIVAEAVRAARENAALNGLDNCTFIAGDVLKVVDELTEKPDLMILDPPRDGIHPKAISKLIGFGVPHIIYVSCKPTSLQRDLQIFRQAGYRTTRCCCVDMFPGTANVETVCLLSKKNAKPKDCVEISVDAEDYYRIKSSEKDI